MTSERYQVMRNILILSGMSIALSIWFFMPDTFRNTSLFHVGNGEYGSKWGMLILIPLPLFALCFRKEKVEFHGDDEEYKKKMQEDSDVNNMKSGMLAALGLSIICVGLMIAALCVSIGTGVTLSVKETTSGFGITGQDFSGYREHKIKNIKEGDVIVGGYIGFYGLRIAMNEREAEKMWFLKINAIDKNGVTVTTYEGTDTIPYGTPMKINAITQVFDGPNCSYELS